MLSREVISGKAKKALALALTGTMAISFALNFVGVQVARAQVPRNTDTLGIGIGSIQSPEQADWDMVYFGKYSGQPVKS